MKEIEEKLTDLQGRHGELTQSYETLQLEYSIVKQEMEMLRRKYENLPPASSYSFPGINEWDATRAETFGPSAFDFSVFSYEPKEEREQEGQGAKV
jgi:AP-1-like transcription factor